jgi:hypothetical protein
MLAIAGEGDEAPGGTAPKRTRKARGPKAGNNMPSEAMLNRVREYVATTSGPLRSRQVAEALGVSQSSAGKTLKMLAKDNQIKYLGTLKDLQKTGEYPNMPAEKGRIDLYGPVATGEAPSDNGSTAETTVEPETTDPVEVA